MTNAGGEPGAAVYIAGVVTRNLEYASPLTLAQVSLERWPVPVAWPSSSAYRTPNAPVVRLPSRYFLDRPRGPER